MSLLFIGIVDSTESISEAYSIVTASASGYP